MPQPCTARSFSLAAADLFWSNRNRKQVQMAVNIEGDLYAPAAIAAYFSSFDTWLGLYPVYG